MKLSSSPFCVVQRRTVLGNEPVLPGGQFGGAVKQEGAPPIKPLLAPVAAGRG